MRSYGNGLVTSAKVMQEQPAALAAFVKASTRGWIEAIADPKAGAAAVKAREPLANEELELERLKLIVDGTMLTPDTRANGWGAATPARLQATLDETVAAFNLKPGATVAGLWSDKFLPPLAERSLKA
jgi:NitT/TauT family transport system substrate-binding protein